jgi:acyl-coenzyme A thioesterase PaaI-like protein
VVARPSHLFRVDGDTLIPTDLVRGPWDHGHQHGGAVCGALGWAVRRALLADDPELADDPDRLQLCRLTTEILRPVPAVALAHRAAVVRRGRRSRVAEAGLYDGDQLVARASSGWSVVRPRDGEGAGQDADVDPAVPLRPVVATDPGASDVGYPRPGFNCDVFELRCLVGSTEEPGPGIVWTRMVVELVEGAGDHPVHRLATVADLGNAVGWTHSPNGVPMVNSDVTLQLLRYPRGEWVCLDSRSRATTGGIGMMETTLWDGDGRFGQVLSTTVESPIPLAIDL